MVKKEKEDGEGENTTAATSKSKTKLHYQTEKPSMRGTKERADEI